MGDIDWELVTKICKFAATVSGGLLAGCGFYVLSVEQPARMEHKEEAAALENWARFYNKAYFVMSGTASLSIVTGATAYFTSRPNSDPYWLLSSGIIFMNIPFSLLAMVPLNNAMLAAEKDGNKDDEWIRTNLNRWTRLHRVRAIFSNSAFAVMVSRLVF